MQITVSGQHVDVTPALNDYVMTKLRRLERHFDHATNAHVVLTVQRQSQKAEATVHVPGGKLHAEAVENDMYAAIDRLADKLDRQIRRHKEKVSDHHREEKGLKSLTG